MESSIVVDTDSLFVLDRIDDGGGSERCNGTSRFHGRTEAEAGGDVKYVRHVNHAMCMASLLLCVRACYGLYMLAGRRQVGMVMDDCFEVVRE